MPSFAAFAATAAVIVAVTGAVAVVAHFAAPTNWRELGERQLPDRASLVVGIFLNNAVIVSTPLLGGWLAAGRRERGERLSACLLAAIAAIVDVRSVVLVGVVGGIDPRWLSAAVRWWSFEAAALGVATYTGYWFLRRPSRRSTTGASALRRASISIVICLAAGALIEVFTA